ncbi:MAG TPA: flagellar motor switch protein FliN [Beijerinckiaceae bacterium]|nr:flagellar motor switch protein FliN [Beijerinckiaceae bacterium]
MTDTPAPQLPDGVTHDRRKATAPGDLLRLTELPVRVTAVVGRADIDIAALLALGPGAVLELDRKIGEPVDILVNERLVARGEIVMVDDRLGVTMTELASG